MKKIITVVYAAFVLMSLLSGCSKKDPIETPEQLAKELIDALINGSEERFTDLMPSENQLTMINEELAQKFSGAKEKTISSFNEIRLEGENLGLIWNKVEINNLKFDKEILDESMGGNEIIEKMKILVNNDQDEAYLIEVRGLIKERTWCTFGGFKNIKKLEGSLKSIKSKALNTAANVAQLISYEYLGKYKNDPMVKGENPFKGLSSTYGNMKIGDNTINLPDNYECKIIDNEVIITHYSGLEGRVSWY